MVLHLPRLVFNIDAKGISDMAYWMNIENVVDQGRRGIDHCRVALGTSVGKRKRSISW